MDAKQTLIDKKYATLSQTLLKQCTFGNDVAIRSRFSTARVVRVVHLNFPLATSMTKMLSNRKKRTICDSIVS